MLVGKIQMLVGLFSTHALVLALLKYILQCRKVSPGTNTGSQSVGDKETNFIALTPGGNGDIATDPLEENGTGKLVNEDQTCILR